MCPGDMVVLKKKELFATLFDSDGFVIHRLTLHADTPLLVLGFETWHTWPNPTDGLMVKALHPTNRVVYVDRKVVRVTR